MASVKMGWRDDLLTYEKGRALVKKARSQKVGKSLGRRAKLRLVGEDLELFVDGERIALINSDNIATLFFPDVRRNRVYGERLGIDRMWNHRAKKPGIIHMKKWLSVEYSKRVDFIVPMVDGVQFCLLTGECLNPSGWPVKRKTDKAGEWRTRMTKFQRALKVMANMEAFNHLPKKVWPEGAILSPATYLRLTPEELYRLIVNEDIHTTVRRLLETAEYWDRYRAQRGELNMRNWAPHEFKYVYNKMRDPVRKLAGCYIEKVPHADEDAVASAA